MIDKLKQRLKELNEQKLIVQATLNQAIADITAISGAMQEITYWIAKTEEENVNSSTVTTEL